MTSKLPINLDDLLRQRTVEGDRIEYKAGLEPGCYRAHVVRVRQRFRESGRRLHCHRAELRCQRPAGFPARRCIHQSTGQDSARAAWVLQPDPAAVPDPNPLPEGGWRRNWG